MHAKIMEAMANAIATSQVIVILLTKAYMESANYKRELNLAINNKRKFLPLLAEVGYDHRADGWLGVTIGELLYYDISSPAKRHATLYDLMKKEFNIVEAPFTSSCLEVSRNKFPKQR